MKIGVLGLTVLLLGVGMMLPGYAEKAYWVKLDDQAALKGDFVAEYDRNSIRYDASTGKGTLWTRQVYGPNSEGYKKDWESVEFQYEIDCQQRTIRSGPLVIYYLDGFDDWDDEWHNDWQPIKPTSVGQTWYEAVCP